MNRTLMMASFIFLLVAFVLSVIWIWETHILVGYGVVSSDYYTFLSAFMWIVIIFNIVGLSILGVGIFMREKKHEPK
mgnify:CR=1 FL=1